MVTTSRSSLISFTVCVFGRLTSMPDCRMGAVIMKMISSTSITSTKGTMLISEREVPVWRASCGIRLFPFTSFLLLLFRVPHPSCPETRRARSVRRVGGAALPSQTSHFGSPPKPKGCHSEEPSDEESLLAFHPSQIILLDQRRYFHGEIIHPRAHLPHIVHQMVVCDHRRDGRKQPRGRGDQRLGDARRHHAQARRSGRTQPGEGVHHAPHRPE